MRVIRAASGVYVVLFALLGLLLARPWQEGGRDATTEWLIPLIGPVLLFVGGSFLYHLARGSYGRWKLCPAWGYGAKEGQWFLWLDPRGPEGTRNYRFTIRDDLGGATSHEFSQSGGAFPDLFPAEYDVSGMKAGRRQPWGTYEVMCELLDNGGKRLAMCRYRFTWRALQLSS